MWHWKLVPLFSPSRIVKLTEKEAKEFLERYSKAIDYLSTAYSPSARFSHPGLNTTATLAAERPERGVHLNIIHKLAFFCPKAQGCEARATLGNRIQIINQP
jgi:hypothetical protein